MASRRGGNQWGYTTEADLAADAVLWLEMRGFTCYCEVSCSGGRADIVAVLGPNVWVVETKIRFGLDLMQQCLDRKREPCQAVIACYPEFQKVQNSHVLYRLAEHEGIGLLPMRPDFVNVEFSVWPALRRMKATRLLSRIEPEMAGNKPGTNGGHLTQFGIMAARLSKELREGRLDLVLSSGLPSFARYRGDETPAQGRRALAYYLHSGFIPGWEVCKDGNRLWVRRKKEP